MYNYILQLTIMTSMEFDAGAEAKYSLTVSLVALSVSTNTVSPGSVPLSFSAHCTKINLVPKLCVTVIVVREPLPIVSLKNLFDNIPSFKVLGVTALALSVPVSTSAWVAISIAPCLVVVAPSAVNCISLVPGLLTVIPPLPVVFLKSTASPVVMEAPPVVLDPFTFRFQPW